MSSDHLLGYEFCCTITPGSGAIDQNGHVNVAQFGIMFEEAATVLMKTLSFGTRYRRQRRCAYFVRENHLKIYREALEREPLSIYSRIVNASDSAFEVMMIMIRDQDLDLISVQNTLWLNVSLDLRKVVSTDRKSLAALKDRIAHQQPCAENITLPKWINFRTSAG
nr:thioesterase family protein [Mesorhizobium sp. WSM4875]